MGWLSRFRLLPKLIASYIVVALLMVLVGLAGLTGLQTTQAQLSVITGYVVPEIIHLKAADSAVQEALSNSRGAILSLDNRAAAVRLRAAAAVARNDALRELVALTQLQQRKSDHAQMSLIDGDLRQWLILDARVSRLSGSGQSVLAKRLSLGQEQSGANSLSAAFDALILNSDAEMTQATMRADQAHDSAVAQLIAASALAGLLAVLFGIIIARAIARPVSAMQEAADRLASGTVADLERAMNALAVGDLDAAHATIDTIPLDVRGRDEVGALAKSFAAMQRAIAATVTSLDMAREGLRENRETLVSRNEALEREVSDRVLADAALRESEQRYRQVEQYAPIGLALQSTDGRYLRVNPALCVLLGYDEAELLTLTFHEITHPHDRASDSRHLRRMLAGEIATYETEKRYIRKDGAPLWVQIAVSLVRTEDDRPNYFISQVQDISERIRAREQAEHARAAAEEHAREFEALAQVSAALAGSLEPERLYQVILEQAALVLPCDHASVTLYGDGVATFVATWGEPRVPSGSTYAMSEIWLPNVDIAVAYVPDTDDDPHWRALPPVVGQYRTRSIISAPLIIDGTVVGAFDVSSRTPHYYGARHRHLAAEFADRATQALRNVRLFAAEQARVRAAEHLAKLQNDFLAAVSHELRTPLTAIVGFGELLQSRWGSMSDDRRLERIGHIVLAANRQKRLVEDLLLASRLEGASRSPLDAIFAPICEKLSLLTLTRQAAAEVQGSYAGQSIVLDGTADIQVQANREHTLQILTNILDNAAKYSPEGSSISIRWGQEANMAILHVEDQGSGIPQEGRDRLFTRFGRLHGSIIRSGRVGTGLGLFISRGLAQSMGGDLELEATGPGGSTFRLRLPSVNDSAPTQGEEVPGVHAA